MGLRTLIRNWLGSNSHQEKDLERELLLEIENRSAFYSSFLKEGSLCFDVGANVGNRIEVFLKVGAKVVAIEPQPSCIEVLQNKFGNKIELVTSGLGESEGEMDFYISNASTISSFAKDWIDSVKVTRFKNYEWNQVVKTPITTLDKLIEKYGTPDFIKIDVEGFELEVLKGLSKSVNLISFEYTVPEQTNKAVECIRTIEKISSAIECNYSVGESMVFARDKWLTVTEMINFVQSKEFSDTDFGDIYVRVK